ncbi:hypothetical protein T484DRAFT_1650336 [Baffinella frigidus]|nr:hypothetical protein T484DRAFT_1650336 [Cryptophyta sp. CCMP2293]
MPTIAAATTPKTATDAGPLKKPCRVPRPKNFSCSFCDRKWDSRDAVRRHENSHTGNKPFKCLECDESFSQKGNLKTHINSVHVKMKHMCVICEKMLSSPTNLHHHIIKTHGEYLGVHCSRCDMWMRGDLTRHQNSTQCKQKTHDACRNGTMLLNRAIYTQDDLIDEGDEKLVDLLLENFYSV